MAQVRKVLMIVESPNKQKTIQAFFKKPVDINGESTQITVIGQIGHDMRLVDKGKYNVGVDFDHEFKPTFQVDPAKNDIVKKIKALAEQTLSEDGYIILAEDADIEGELLAMEQIRILKLKDKDYVRVTYNEITESVILNAIKNSRKIDMNRVDSAEARTILDKIVGYRLSPMAHKWVGAKSVGRVQSATLKILTDREKEIINFVPQKYWNLYVDFTKDNQDYKAQYKGENANGKGTDIKEESVVNKIISDCDNAKFIAKGIYSKTRIVKSPLPYTTSTFQVEAASKFGISPKRVMSIAEDLFSQAKITYIRTDSSTMSDEFAAKLADFVKSKYGEDYFQPVKTAKADKLVQGAHECIRVVSLDLTPKDFAQECDDPMTKHIYELIYNRTVAASMKDCIMLDTVYPIYATTHRFEYTAHAIKFDGFRKVIPLANTNKDEDSDDDSLDADPKLTENELVHNNPPLIKDEKQTSPKKRFTEASLASEMSSLGIGRPSTTASIIAILEDPDRNYNKLDGRSICPTKLGMTLSEWLARAFPDLINLTYTKDMELKLDDIADGKFAKLDFLNNFYTQLCADIDKIKEVPVMKEQPKETGETCPLCGKPLVEREGKYGKFVACSGYPACHYVKPRDHTEGAQSGNTQNAQSGQTQAQHAPAKQVEGRVCPKCGKPLVYRISKKGTEFIGCSGWKPNHEGCDYIEFKDKTTGEYKPYTPKPQGSYSGSYKSGYHKSGYSNYKKNDNSGSDTSGGGRSL
jgi:DNA topoisomerase-1